MTSFFKSIISSLFCFSHEWGRDAYCLDQESANVSMFRCKKCGHTVKLYCDDGCRWNPNYDRVEKEFKQQEGEKSRAVS